MHDLQMARIGDYCKVAKGKIGIKKAVAGKYPLVTTAEERLSHNEYHFDKPSVIIPLVSSTGHGHASLKRIHYQEGKFAVGSILCAVIPKDEKVLSANFLYHYLDVYKEKLLTSRMRGMANVTLPVSEIEDVEFPMLSIDEQKEWVSLFENTSSYTSSLASESNRQQSLLKKLRQSILQDAISGKLTKKWREENLPAPASSPGKFYAYAILCHDNSIYIGHTDDIARRWKEHRKGQGAEWTKKYKPLSACNAQAGMKIAHYEEYKTRKEAADREKWLKTGFGRKWLKRELAAGRTRQAGVVEPASELLARIKAEKERLGKEKKTKKQKPLPPISEEEIPFELPEGWVWCRLGEFVKSFQNGISKRHGSRGEDCIVLRLADITNYRVNFYEPRYIKLTQDEIIKYELKPYDILITRVNGSVEIVGNFNLVELVSEKIGYCDHFIRMRLSQGNVLSPYVEILEKTKMVRNIIKDQFKTTAGQKTINQGHINNLLVPLPPLCEANIIVSKVEKIFAYCDELEQQIDKSQLASELLMQTVLKEAFEG